MQREARERERQAKKEAKEAEKSEKQQSALMKRMEKETEKLAKKVTTPPVYFTWMCRQTVIDFDPARPALKLTVPMLGIPILGAQWKCGRTVLKIHDYYQFQRSR